MRFRTKIILGYALVALASAFVLGSFYNKYNVKEYYDVAINNARFLSEQLIKSIDESMNTMEQVIDSVLSDKEVLDAIYTLASQAKGNIRDMEDEKKEIQSYFTTNYIFTNFYRVIYFNPFGDVIYSNFTDRLIDMDKSISDISWIDQVEGTKGKEVLLGIHEDDWRNTKKEIVYSMVKEIQGKDMGYIEVQRKQEYFDNLFSFDEWQYNLVVLLPDQSLLYYKGNPDYKEYYQSVMSEKYLSEGEIVNRISGKKEMVTVNRSEKYGIQIMIAQDMGEILTEARKSFLFAVLIAGTFFVVSMIFVIIISGQLAKPIRKLKTQMEQTGLENMDGMPLIVSTNDEIETLGRSYQQLMSRLKESIIKEKRASLLQLQAQFDTLQAQVNPHFLYNVLNVISSRGVLSGDEKICEICGSLAAMLRYSTSTLERYATVREEVEYLKQYIYLLKSRYDHRLEVDILCEEEIMDEIIPKIAIQQLVENSISHGFVEKTEIMKIQVIGWRDQHGWYVEVMDNGQGVSPDALESLTKKIEKIQNKILKKQSNIEFEIGGMGLANTYARFFLLYADRTVFRISNREGGEGASVMIGVLREESLDVSDNDC